MLNSGEEAPLDQLVECIVTKGAGFSGGEENVHDINEVFFCSAFCFLSFLSLDLGLSRYKINLQLAIPCALHDTITVSSNCPYPYQIMSTIPS